MVQVTEEPPPALAVHLSGSTPLARWAAVVAAVVVGIALGALGTALVTPGQSLAVPTAIVAAVGGGIVLVSWVVASFRLIDRRAGFSP